MNDTNRIEALLEKYYRGETSTAEEKILRDFFSGPDVPSHLSAEADMFRYFSGSAGQDLPGEVEDTLPGEAQDTLSGEARDTLPGKAKLNLPGEERLDNLESRLLDMIGDADTGSEDISGLQRGKDSRMDMPEKAGRGIRMNTTFWMSAAAAVILILVGIFVDMQIRSKNTLEVRQDTYEDPYLAYAEAKRALYIVSEKMNAGKKPLKNIEKLDAGVNYVHPVFSFGAGIRHLEHLNKIEETKQILSKETEL